MLLGSSLGGIIVKSIDTQAKAQEALPTGESLLPFDIETEDLALEFGLGSLRPSRRSCLSCLPMSDLCLFLLGFIGG